MYAYAIHEPLGLMVARQSRGGTSSEDASQMAEAVLALARLSRPISLGRVYLLTVDRDSPHPGPAERDRIARAWKQVDASETLFCVVTSSAVVRATFEVVSLLRQTSSAHGKVFENHSDALRFIEVTRPGIRGAVVALEEHVNDALKSRELALRRANG